MKPIRFHHEAILELDAAIAWYNCRRAGLGMSLHAEVQAVLDRISADPQSGVKATIEPYRYCSTRQFPYVLYWLETDEVIWIAAIAHTRRRPGFWKNRAIDQSLE